jgi:hypothetical protein
VRCPCKLVDTYLFALLLLFGTGVFAVGQEANQSSNSGAAGNQPAHRLNSGAASAPDTDKPGQTLSYPGKTDQPLDVSLYCEALSRRITQPSALAHVCEFALSLGQRLPSVICSQETRRYRDFGLRGFRLQDVVTAQVTYEEGTEHYRDLAINGNPIKSSTPTLSAGWSTGEFASALLAVFSPLSQAEFKFKKNDVLRATPALVFEFQILRENNKLWQVGDAKTFPGYSGRLWVNQVNFHLMRLERGDIKVDVHSPIRQLISVIDYADVQLGDGTSFDVPVQSETVACHAANLTPCWRSVLVFRNWRKFAARSRILSDTEPQPVQTPKAGSEPKATLAEPTQGPSRQER